jgi:organic hydroperoxide reductase OsmC/OhrA
MAKNHTYTLTVDWTGNRGTGTSAYGAYGRDHAIRAPGKPVIAGSSDPAFRGDAARYNPEDLLVASIAACHMLWYLHLCAVRKIVVTAYRDEPVGVMEEGADGGGRFTQVTLRPAVTLAPGADGNLAKRLHEEAHAKCFIANSVNFPIAHAATIVIAC